MRFLQLVFYLFQIYIFLNRSRGYYLSWYLLLKVCGNEDTSLISNDASDSDVFVRIQNAGRYATECNYNCRGSSTNSDINSSRMFPRSIQFDSASYPIPYLGSFHLWHQGVSSLGRTA